MKKAILTVAMAGTVFGLVTTAVKAADQSQEMAQGQAQEMVCETTGAYGEMKCEAKQAQVQTATQEQNLADEDSNIVYINGEAIEAHDPADTALDVKTSVAAFSSIMSGVTAAVIKRKNRVA